MSITGRKPVGATSSEGFCGVELVETIGLTPS